MTKAQTVWCSDFLRSGKLHRNIDFEFESNDSEARAKFSSNVRNGTRIEKKNLPKRFHFGIKIWDDVIPSLPDICWGIGGLVLVSERFKTLLQEFNLGGTQFFEVPVQLLDAPTPLKGGPYFLMNYTEFRAIGVPEQTPSAIKVTISWSAGPLTTKSKVAVRPDALGELDFAVDTELRQLSIFSDRLAKAIKAAKIKPLTLVKCIQADA